MRKLLHATLLRQRGCKVASRALRFLVTGAGAGSSMARIALVEDSEEVRRFAKMLLVRKGFAVDEYPDGAAALDGIQATAQVMKEVPGVAVVALTASADAAEREALVEAGAVACLMKDQELEEIVAAILQAAAATG